MPTTVKKSAKKKATTGKAEAYRRIVAHGIKDNNEIIQRAKDEFGVELSRNYLYMLKQKSKKGGKENLSKARLTANGSSNVVQIVVAANKLIELCGSKSDATQVLDALN